LPERTAAPASPTAPRISGPRGADRSRAIRCSTGGLGAPLLPMRAGRRRRRSPRARRAARPRRRRWARPLVGLVALREPSGPRRPGPPPRAPTLGRRENKGARRDTALGRRDGFPRASPGRRSRCTTRKSPRRPPSRPVWAPTRKGRKRGAAPDLLPRRAHGRVPVGTAGGWSGMMHPTLAGTRPNGS
jgi:hypothetical protein